MNTHGGKRNGAGKKKGTKASHTLETQELKKNLIALYQANAQPINQALIDKAVTGDIPAIKEVYDRVFGKSLQAVEMTGKEGKDLFTPSDNLMKLADALIKIQKGGNS